MKGGGTSINVNILVIDEVSIVKEEVEVLEDLVEAK
jgi:hypothetical protein